MTDPAEPRDPSLPPPHQTFINKQPNFGAQGVFYDRVEVNTHLPPPPPPMPLDQALALLAELPLDDIPAPQTLPQPHRMPYAPNPLFVGREDDLRHIAAQLKASGTVAVITAVTAGIGGVGKTQLAIEAVHRYGRYFGGGVFWLSFADPSGIALEIAACGRTMGAFHDAEKLELEAQVQKTLARWASEQPCLLIFDNCEDEALLRTWQPRTGGCRVLITSRKQTAWSPELEVILLPLEVLARAESIRLLQQLAPRLSNGEADAVAAELGDLPLALHLAGRYLARYSIVVEDYLTKLRAVTLRHASLTGRGVTALPTNREPHVERAFALSFDRLEADDPIDDLARQLLARAACFAPGEPSGRSWLEATITPEGDEEEQQLARTDAVERLLGLGLLESMGEGGVRLHRLLAAYTALTVDDAAALPVVERVVGRVAYLANETGVPQVMLPVLPHLRHLVQGTQGREDEQVAALCANLGVHLNAAGAYGEALSLFERAMALFERVLGADHPDTIASLNNLAELYQAQGMYDQAHPLLERALTLSEQVQGSDHPNTVIILSNLAKLYRVQGAYDKAYSLYKQALAANERVLGSHHLNTALSLNNLALLYQTQGAYDKARPLVQRALSIREHTLGPDHPDTILSLNNFAGLLLDLGLYGEAHPLMERALATNERVLGPDHPQTAINLNNLALLLALQGAYDKASALHQRALMIREQVLGANHPDTAISLNNLAKLYQAQGAYHKARPLLERALSIRERMLGADHPDTATSLNDLAELLKDVGAYAEARPLLERALSIRERVLGADHPDTATSLNNLAFLLHEQGAYDRVRPLLERALIISERVLGADHPNTATSLNNLAVLHANQGQFASALTLLERVITIRQVRLGPQHPLTMQTQQSLTVLRERMARADHLNAPHATSTPSRPSSQNTSGFRYAPELARAQAKVAAVGADPQARADLAARFRAMADLHAQGKYANPELAAQLRALATQLTS